MAINSKDKGKRGEREFAEFLRERGIDARRGVQYSGSPDSPDVVTELPDYHFEVKRTEKLSIHEGINQAIRDAGNKIPIVAHKKNRCEWLAIMRMEDLIKLIKH